MSISYTEINTNSKIFPNQVAVGVDRNDYPKASVLNLTSAGWKSNEQLVADVAYLNLLTSEPDTENVDIVALSQYYAAGTISAARLGALVTKGVITQEQINEITGETTSEPEDNSDPKEEEKDNPDPEEDEEEKPFVLTITTTLNKDMVTDDVSSFSQKFETNVPNEEAGNVTWNYSGDVPDGFILAGDTISIQNYENETGVFKFTMEAKYKEQTATKPCTISIVDDIL